MEDRVREYIQRNHLIAPGQKVGAAVSGGSDSMALLSCLYDLREKLQFELLCIHFEHGIRGEDSLADAALVETYANKLDIPFYLGAADVPKLAKRQGISEEYAAKLARESYFERLVKEREADVIATGHHQEDNAESVLMHILRGSGIEGLRGVHIKKDFFIRPLLCVSKVEILRFIQERNIPFAEDCTNKDNSYTRNFVRNILIPQIEDRVNEDVIGALNRLSAIASADSKYLNGEAEKVYRECASKEGDKVLIDIESFTELPPSLQYRVLKLAVRALHLLTDIEYSHVISVIELAEKAKTGTRVSLSGPLCAEVEYGLLLIRFSGRRVNTAFDRWFDLLAVNEFPGGEMRAQRVSECNFQNTDETIAYVDGAKLPQRIKVRTRQDGDVIRPLGSPGEKKLKDYFIDKKLIREERDRIPLLADGNRILWIAGHTISDDVRVTPETKNIWRIKYYKRTEE